jgi:hypothetical protein
MKTVSLRITIRRKNHGGLWQVRVTAGTEAPIETQIPGHIAVFHAAVPIGRICRLSVCDQDLSAEPGEAYNRTFIAGTTPPSTSPEEALLVEVVEN